MSLIYEEDGNDHTDDPKISGGLCILARRARSSGRARLLLLVLFLVGRVILELFLLKPGLGYRQEEGTLERVLLAVLTDGWFLRDMVRKRVKFEDISPYRVWQNVTTNFATAAGVTGALLER